MKLHVHVYSNQLPKFMDDSVQHNWICRECLNLLKNCERESDFSRHTASKNYLWHIVHVFGQC